MLSKEHEAGLQVVVKEEKQAGGIDHNPLAGVAY